LLIAGLRASAEQPPPFRLSDASVPRIPFDVEDARRLPGRLVPAAYPRDRVWLHVTLFLATVLTTTLMGALQYAGFILDFGARPVALSWGALFPRGLWYSLTILGILGTHEFGHYYACLRYRVNASLPYFIPLPPPFETGTAGAFIRIRQAIGSKRALFDIGVAGPLAGFAVAVPTLVAGIALSHVVPEPRHIEGLRSLGEPLIFKFASWVVWGNLANGYTINIHPMAYAAWFGLLATVLNLFPAGQLDGGHITYAVLGRRAYYVTLGAVAGLIGLCFFSYFWIGWTTLVVVMLNVFGFRHPPTLDEREPLDRTRLALAFVALVVFVLCFTPAPIEPLDLIQK
jgi:membrane-associated protease RseP (regulator of RpoE activity)